MLKRLIEEAVDLRQFFKKEKAFRLKELSAELIRESALHDDKFKALMALIAYSLFKLESKTHIKKSQKWPSAKERILKHLDNAILELRQKRFKDSETELQNAVEDISRIDSEISNYALNVFEKAKTKLASTAYSFGLSLSQAAMLTGADKKNLLNYIGFTKMHDEAGVSIGINERLKALKEVLSA